MHIDSESGDDIAQARQAGRRVAGRFGPLDLLLGDATAPRQVGAALALVQSIPAVVATAIGVPLGLAIYFAAQATGGDDAATTPGAFLVVTVPAILLLTIALTLVPTRLAALQSVVVALRGDACRRLS